MKRLLFLLLLFLGCQVFAGTFFPSLMRLLEVQGLWVPVGYCSAHAARITVLSLILSNVLLFFLIFLWRMLPPERTLGRKSTFPWAFLLFVPAMIGVNILSEYLQFQNLLAEFFLSERRDPFFIISVAFLGPVAEEFVFRRGMTGSLLQKKYPQWQALLVPAALFGVVHANPAQMVAAFLLGLLLGWIYVRTGSLLVCCLLHVFNNSLSVVLLNLCPELTFRAAVGDTVWQALFLVALACLTAGTLWLFNRKTREDAPVCNPINQDATQ